MGEVTEKRGQRQSEKRIGGVLYRHVYHVKGDEALTFAEVYDALDSEVGITSGSAYPDDASALASSIVPQVTERPDLYEVTVTWETPQHGSAIDPNPLSRPWEIRWGGTSEWRNIFEDLDGKAICNSAGDRFDELPQALRGEETLTITRNESTAFFDPTLIRLYQCSINNASVTLDGFVFPARTVMMEITDAPKITEGLTTYYRVTYLFRFAPDTWDVDDVLDVGYYELSGGDKIKILDEDGLEITKPWPLDGSGGKKADPTAAPAKLAFKFNEILNFGVFNFA